MRDLMRLAGSDVIDPEIAGSGGAVVVVEQARAVFSEGGTPARRLVHAFRDGQSGRLAGREIVQVDVFIAIDVGAEGEVLAVRRELAAADFPFVFREPLDWSLVKYSCDGGTFVTEVEKADVVVPVRSVRGDEYFPSVRNWTGINFVSEIKLLAFVRSEQ